MKKKKSIAKELILLFVFAALISLIIILFYPNIWLVGGLLLILAIAKLIYLKDKVSVIMFFLGGIWGTLAEMIAIYFGAWNYSYFNFYNVPIWLFLAWGCITLFFYRLGLLIKLYMERK